MLWFTASAIRTAFVPRATTSRAANATIRTFGWKRINNRPTDAWTRDWTSSRIYSGRQTTTSLRPPVGQRTQQKNPVQYTPRSSFQQQHYYTTPTNNKMTAHTSNINPPPLPRGKGKHHIVVLEAIHCDMPTFDFPHTIDLHLRTRPDQVAERIKDATIVIACVVPVTPSDMDQAPHLGILAVMAVGVGWVDKLDCARRGVTVTNCIAGNVDAVTEHFLGLYFAARKQIVAAHNSVTTSHEWRDRGTLTKTFWPPGPPMGCSQETLGIMGYGSLGTRIEKLARAVGFKEVLISERKTKKHHNTADNNNSSGNNDAATDTIANVASNNTIANATSNDTIARNTGSGSVRQGRVPFTQVLSRATTICICLPKENDTVDLIAEQELRAMRPDALLINMARGGIVNEAALAKALREGWIAGAATDVLEIEPAWPGSGPLTPDLAKGESAVPNLTICKSSTCCLANCISALLAFAVSVFMPPPSVTCFLFSISPLLLLLLSSRTLLSPGNQLSCFPLLSFTDLSLFHGPAYLPRLAIADVYPLLSGFFIAPHIAWFTQSTIKNYQRLLKEGIEGWVAGTLQETPDRVKKVVVVHGGKVWR